MTRPALNWLLSVGFLAIAVAVAVARASPPDGYEASIYAGTPTVTWVGIAVAFAVALGVTLACRGRYQALGIALGATAITSIVSLPLTRNYRFSGMGDALTHLGWTTDIVDGSLAPYELFYPGMHSLGAIIHLVGGVPLERALLFSLVVVFVLFVVFVPLVVRDITGNAAAVGFAAIVSWFVLPINNIATHTSVHTNSNALFFAPVVIFAIVAYLRRHGDHTALPFGVSPYGVVVLVTGAGLLFVHPQQMVNVVLVLATISLIQFVARHRYVSHPIVEQPTAYAHTVVLGGFFLVWSASNERFRQAFAGLIYGLLTQDVGTGEEVEQRETSLAEIGGSVPELFTKLFLVSALVAVVVGLFVLLTWLGWTRTDRESKAFVTYFGVASIPLSVIFVVYFFGTQAMAFRQVGFIYVLGTILAGIGLAHGFGRLAGLLPRPGSNTLAAILLGTCLVLSLPVVFASPYIYSPTQHVTDQKVSGYGSALEHGDDRPYAGLGFGVNRYGDGLNGVEGDERGNYEGVDDGRVDVDEFESGNYSGAYGDGEYYFVATEYDETREFEVYQELHHSEAALEGVDASPNANKVVSNEEFRMYAIESDE